MCPTDLGVKRSKVKVAMHRVVKIILVHDCFPFTSIIIKLQVYRLPMSRGCASMISGQKVKGQCIDYFKLSPVYYCFPISPIIMKLHPQTPHESRVCPIDIGVKTWRVHDSQFLNQNCFPFQSLMCMEKDVAY